MPINSELYIYLWKSIHAADERQFCFVDINGKQVTYKGRLVPAFSQHHVLVRHILVSEKEAGSSSNRFNNNNFSFWAMTHVKKCFSIPTTHGLTYCETYEPFVPAVDPVQLEQSLNKSSQVILMVHGCGGSVDHWNLSGIPELLANQGNTVVCFDWYSHGKSAKLSGKVVHHDLDLFFTQLNDVIHSPDLPVSRSQRFVAHAFSMGCFILLQYCVRYKPFLNLSCNGGTSPQKVQTSSPRETNDAVEHGHNSSTTNNGPPYIHKIVLQSPWDGHLPSFLRGLIRVPLLLRVCKPSDMSGIKSIRALKQLLLELDRDIDYKESMEQFARALISSTVSDVSNVNSLNFGSSSSSDASEPSSPAGGKNSSGSDKVFRSPALSREDTVDLSGFDIRSGGSPCGSPCGSPKVDSPVAVVACSVLTIAGSREPPFLFNAQRITQQLRRQLSEQSGGELDGPSGDNSAREESRSVRAQLLEEQIQAHFQTKTCKYAGHMSFAKHGEDSYVRKFFHKEISEFVAQKPQLLHSSSVDF